MLSTRIFVYRDLSISLSSCMFQALCDSETMSKTKIGEALMHGPGLETMGRLSLVANDSSYLMYTPTGRRRSSALGGGDQPAVVHTEPCKWPGVTSLRALLDRDKDDDAPNLTVLLSETYASVYLSLLLYGLSTCDSRLLFRLARQTGSKSAWSSLFGGGAKRQLKVETLAPLTKEQAADAPDNLLSTGINTVTNITKQRLKLNMKLLNVQIGTPPQDGGEHFGNQAAAAPATERRQAYREEFVPPDSSILGRLMSKHPEPPAGAENSKQHHAPEDYDSGDESEPDDGSDYDDDDDDDPFSAAPAKSENREHNDADSYSWAVLRLAMLAVGQKHIETFLSVAGIDLAELPLVSPLMYKCLRVTAKWSKAITERLVREGRPPENFIPGCFADSAAQGPLINKYKAMLEPHNTPYPAKGRGLGPIKRLWRFLVHQELVQPIFIRYIFGKSRKMGELDQRGHGGAYDDSESRVGDDYAPDGDAGGHMKVIYKDQVGMPIFFWPFLSQIIML